MDKGYTVPLYGDGHGRLTLIDWMGDDLTAVNSARVSFGRTSADLSKTDIKLLRYLAEHRHTSPFEHCSVTFRARVPLFVARQWMRHRTQSFNEVSRRYTGEDLRIYIPKVLRAQSKDNRQASAGELDAPTALAEYEYVVLRAKESYDRLTASGVARELARAVLPQAMYTEFYATANLLNWLKFIELRDHEGAQQEIVEVAREIKSVLEALYPETLRAWFERDGDKA